MSLKSARANWQVGDPGKSCSANSKIVYRQNPFLLQKPVFVLLKPSADWKGSSQRHPE